MLFLETVSVYRCYSRLTARLIFKTSRGPTVKNKQTNWDRALLKLLSKTQHQRNYSDQSQQEQTAR